jgi:Uma2 family endonuclease
MEGRAMPISEATYERVALEDDEGKWELVCGQLRRKPPMTAGHQEIARILALDLGLQLPRRELSVGQDSPNLRVPGGNYRVPDVCVIPRSLIQQRRREHPTELELYDEPMPLVVEIWSPSTGERDLTEKLSEYQRRCDLEIWYIHPYERTLTAWVRQGDGSYRQTLYTDGAVRPAFLPNVTIELESLFE